MQQLYKGIPIFQASQSVRFAPDGTLQDTSGQTITVPDTIEASPALSVTDAVRRAPGHVATPDADEAGQVDQFGQALSAPNVDLTRVQLAVGHARVFRANPATMARELTAFPRLLVDFGLDLPNVPQGFLDERVTVNQTVGNCINPDLGVTGPPLQETMLNGKLIFTPSSDSGPDQQVLNVFYFNCFIHDFFYLLGFRDADGNSQIDNFGRGGLLGNAVNARAHPGPVTGTAIWARPSTGAVPS